MPWVKAKLDTGARTSTVHAFDLQEFRRDGGPWVRFSVHPWQRSADDAVDAELPVYDRRRVRSSSGHIEQRIVVQMDVELVGHKIAAEVTLSRRDTMGFRMLIGRQALRRDFVIDPGRSYLGGRPKKLTRRKNRGR